MHTCLDCIATNISNKIYTCANISYIEGLTESIDIMMNATFGDVQTL